jgi:hypothetical protein
MVIVRLPLTLCLSLHAIVLSGEIHICGPAGHSSRIVARRQTPQHLAHPPRRAKIAPAAWTHAHETLRPLLSRESILRLHDQIG